jgi:hypothetical protein
LNGLTKCQRLYPHIHQCNGFFIAKLQKQWGENIKSSRTEIAQSPLWSFFGV